MDTFQSKVRDAVEEGRALKFSAEEALAIFKREWLEQLMLKAKGNQCRVAADLGIHRNTLRRHLDELGVPVILGRPLRRHGRVVELRP